MWKYGTYENPLQFAHELSQICIYIPTFLRWKGAPYFTRGGMLNLHNCDIQPYKTHFYYKIRHSIRI